MVSAAVGVVTGLVQEFQFGMDWSQYSRTVGDVFGAPLAMEGLAAFFLESTFLGLWLFGSGQAAPGRVHLATIWAVAAGGALSAGFILAANSWMQHPVGYQINKSTGRSAAQRLSGHCSPIRYSYADTVHVLLASLVTGRASSCSAVSAWQLLKGKEPGGVSAVRRASRWSSCFPTLMLAMLVGSELGVTEGKYQPMKIAGAEAQWTTCQPCSFSIFQVGGGNNDETPTKLIEIPHLLSLLATEPWNGQVLGLNQVQAQYQQQYGPGYYVPNVFVQYWSMRVMAYLAAWSSWSVCGDLAPPDVAGVPVAPAHFGVGAAVPFVINTAGWLLTENGRQPWIVQGLLWTANGVSPSVGTATIATSLGRLLPRVRGARGRRGL